MHSPDRAEARKPNLGVVAIGRNEGERLRTCLHSVVGGARQIVYVDSGSTDGSVELASAMGADVVELDQRLPFNAGRARNEGFRRLRALRPDLDYVLFVDGDCEVAPDWPRSAAAFLDAHADVAVVCGRLYERHPEQSVYNMLCAIEWGLRPTGEAPACGGNAAMRVAAVADVGGFRLDLVSGEEPELCIRLRAAGWRIWFLAEAQVVHDAAITRFGQWWKRAVRSGYGATQGALLHGGPPEFHCMRLLASSWFWVLGVPLGALALQPWLGGWAWLLLLLYPLQLLRLGLRGPTGDRRDWWWAAFSLVIKYPNFVGQLQCLLHHCLHRKPRLIDYKSPPPRATEPR